MRGCLLKIGSTCSWRLVTAVALVVGVVAGSAADEQTAIEPGSATRQATTYQANVEREKLRYAGRSFDEWRDRLLNDLDPETWKQAMAPLVAFAKNGYAEEAVDALTQRLYDDRDDVSDEAAKSLAKVGAPAVGALAKGLCHERALVRLHSAYALAEIGAAAEPAATALLPVLADEDDSVRLAAVQALAAVAGDDKRVKSAIEGLAASDEVPVRSRLVAGLGGNPPQRGWRLALLLQLANDPSVQVRMAVGELLAGKSPSTTEVATALKRLMRDGEHRVRRSVLEALVSGGNSATKIPILVEALTAVDDGEQLRRSGYALRAIDVLGGAADQAEIVVPALIEIVDGNVDSMGPKELLGAIDALGKQGPRAKRAVPTLERCVFDDQAVSVGNGDLMQKHAQRALRKIAASMTVSPDAE